MTQTVSVIQGSQVMKGLVALTMEGLGMKAEEYGIVADAEVDAEELSEGIKRLMAVDQGVSIRTRFSIGDLYNMTPKRHGVREQLAVMVFGEGVTTTQRQRLRTCGWVANKWPRAKRSDKRPWSWYIANSPGHGPIEKRDLPETELIPTTIEELPLERVLRCRDGQGRKFVIRYPRSAEYLAPETIEPEHGSRQLVTAFLGE